ncbi:MAG: DUF6431 domain-containing protein [candidate division NC10 bacterium]
MSHDRLFPPPRSEACLVRRRPSGQKGGTIIAEDVTDRATHDRRICDPDGYRPAFCPNCGERTLHVHDYRERILRAEPGEPVARVVRHECVGCDGLWQILPAFIARHLWRTWSVVEHTLMGAGPAPATCETRRRPRVPERTQRRWRARWLRPARFLAQVLAACGEAAWAALAAGLGPEATCADLVAAYAGARATPTGRLLASLATLVDRLQPTVRLM